MAVSYSLHVGSGKHNIQTKAQLKNAEKHNARKFKNTANKEIDQSRTKENIFLRGNKNIYQNVRDKYDELFEGSRLEYNAKQKRDDRQIHDYMEQVSNSKKQAVATEIIIQLGDKEFWEGRDISDTKKMKDVFEDQLKYLEKKLQNFAICNAVVHLDEASPHVQIIGIPYTTNSKRGMKSQVSKRTVFSQEKLIEMQEEMRKIAIKKYNEIYQTNEVLKDKKPGRQYVNISDYKKKKEQVKNYLQAAENLLSKKSNFLGKISYTKEELEELKKFVVDKDFFVEYLDKMSIIQEQTKVMSDKKIKLEKELSSLERIQENLKKAEEKILKLEERTKEKLRKIEFKAEEKVRTLEQKEKILQKSIAKKEQKIAERIDGTIEEFNLFKKDKDELIKKYARADEKFRTTLKAKLYDFHNHDLEKESKLVLNIFKKQISHKKAKSIGIER